MWSSSLRRNVVCLLVTLQLPLAGTGTPYGGQSMAAAVADQYIEFRIRSQNLHMDDVERKLSELEHHFGSLDVTRIEESLDRVEARVRSMESTNCKENELVCGGEDQQCVNHLLVCDGTIDCNNGRDENNKLCSIDLLRVGATFKGQYAVNVGLKVFDMQLLVTVAQVHRSPFFTPHTRLKVRFDILFPEYRVAYDFNGRYVHASRTLMITRGSPTDEPYVTLCEFRLADDDRMFCTIHLEASMHKTIRYVLVRA